MNRALKATLYSLFIIPGAGQFYLKRHKSGLLFLAAAGISLLYIITELLQRAVLILAKINQGEIQATAVAIKEALHANPNPESTTNLSIATYLLVITWLASLIDAHRAGRLQDQNSSLDKRRE